MAKKASFKEYLKALKLIRTNPELKKRFDKNRDGSLDPDELEKGAAILGQELKPKSNDAKKIKRKYRRIRNPQAAENLS